LKSIDLQRIRPWIILLEAVEPQTRAPSHGKWEPLLLSNNYRFSYFDGLNRYYISSERFEELNPNLSVQPNVFDGYRRVF
jgi:hypothetical protein